MFRGGHSADLFQAVVEVHSSDRVINSYEMQRFGRKEAWELEIWGDDVRSVVWAPNYASGNMCCVGGLGANRGLGTSPDEDWRKLIGRARGKEGDTILPKVEAGMCGHPDDGPI